RRCRRFRTIIRILALRRVRWRRGRRRRAAARIEVAPRHQRIGLQQQLQQPMEEQEPNDAIARCGDGIAGGGGAPWAAAWGSVEDGTGVDIGGQPIAGLTAGDFQIKDNGQAVTLAGFQAETRSGPRQRSIAFLFDDLSTDAESLDWARRAAADYVAKGGVAGDRWAVLTTSRTLRLDYTSDRDAVKAVLDRVATQGKANQATQLSARAKTDVMHGGGNADEQTQAVSAYTLDGISNALAYAGAQPGQSVLIFTSTGFPTDFPANGTDLNSQVERLRQAAIRSGVTVGAVDPAAINPGNSSLRWQLEVNVLSMLA